MWVFTTGWWWCSFELQVVVDELSSSICHQVFLLKDHGKLRTMSSPSRNLFVGVGFFFLMELSALGVWIFCLQVEVNFEDKETYEYMFKEYWLGLKNRLSLTMPELDENGKPVKGNHGDAAEEDGRSDTENQDPSDVDKLNFVSERAVDDEYDKDGVNDLDRGKGSRKKIKVSPENLVMENKAVAFTEGGEEKEEEENAYEQEEDVNDDDDYYDDDMAVEVPPSRKIEGWASKEVMDFIIHMNGDPIKPLTKLAVHHLLWSYIKQHQLQDPTKKNQVTCDERLQVIFGKKKSMGLSEMYKQLKEHFPQKNPPVSAATKSFKEADRTVKDNTHEGDSGAADKLDHDPAKDKRRGQRRSKEKFERPNRNDFAAITPKNIDLIYLRRALLEHLLDDAEFERKVVDTFVRIRVPGNASTSETCYRLVLVTGNSHTTTNARVLRIDFTMCHTLRRTALVVTFCSNPLLNFWFRFHFLVFFFFHLFFDFLGCFLSGFF